MANKIQIKRGNKANLGNAGVLPGELKYALDTQELFIGNGTANVQIGGNPLNFPISTATQSALDTKVNKSDVDSSLSSTSTNPVQNKVINQELQPQNLLNKIKTVDGTGSGFDADLLDGKHAGNISGAIPINNGTLNTNLFAEKANKNANGVTITDFTTFDPTTLNLEVGESCNFYGIGATNKPPFTGTTISTGVIQRVHGTHYMVIAYGGTNTSFPYDLQFALGGYYNNVFQGWQLYHSLGILDINDGNLSWGGKPTVNELTPLSLATRSINYLQFADPDFLTVEYSNDRGETWTDYGLTDSQKQCLYNINYLSTEVYTGGLVNPKGTIDDRLRLTFDFNIYTVNAHMNAIDIYYSTNSIRSPWIVVELSADYGSTYKQIARATPQGIPGCLTIPLKSTRLNYNVRLRITCGYDTPAPSSSYNEKLAIRNINIRGNQVWGTTYNNPMTTLGVPYHVKYNKESSFIGNVRSPKFIGPLKGTADSATNADYAEKSVRLQNYNVGSASQPIYFSDGLPVVCTNIQAAVASKLGTSSVGNAVTPIYLNNGSPVAGTPYSEASVKEAHFSEFANRWASINDEDIVPVNMGDVDSPIYIADGHAVPCTPYEQAFVKYAEDAGYADSSSQAATANTATKLDVGNVGNSTSPVYFQNGLPVECTPYNEAQVCTASYAGTAGHATTALSARFLENQNGDFLYCGGGNGLILVSNGEVIDSIATVGDSIRPVFLSNGKLTACSRDIPDVTNMPSGQVSITATDINNNTTTYNFCVV